MKCRIGSSIKSPVRLERGAGPEEGARAGESVCDRVNDLEKRLKLMERQRQQRRARRHRADVPVVAIVGYTNVHFIFIFFQANFYLPIIALTKFYGVANQIRNHLNNTILVIIQNVWFCIYII